jgi:hypothetical protein
MNRDMVDLFAVVMVISSLLFFLSQVVSCEENSRNKRAECILQLKDKDLCSGF